IRVRPRHPHRRHGEYCRWAVPVEQARWATDHAAVPGALVLGWAIASRGAGPLEGCRSGNDDDPEPVSLGSAGAPAKGGRPFAEPACGPDRDRPESKRWTHRAADAWKEGDGVADKPICRLGHAVGKARLASGPVHGRAMPRQVHHGYPVAARER